MSNERKSEAFCKKLVENLVDEELRPLIDAERNEDEISLKIAEVERLYKAKARGPYIWDVYKTDLAKKIRAISGVASTFKDKNKEDEEFKEKEKTREEMRSIKIQEEETLRKSRQEDIIKQEKQVEDDYNERSEAILAQVTQLLKTHAGLAKELQEVKAKLEEETKKMKEELNMKKKQMQ
ncbi:uncharacterized protein PF3D7_1120000-like [Ptychodera flava]|uniref:uncharacterized protein PF3D7_1120000-like n=1 Tax=Ptychodera flava TaxID=63121 RepID=UPI00396A09FE